MSLVRQAARSHSLLALALPGAFGLLFLYGAWDMARIHNYRGMAYTLVTAAVVFCPIVLTVLAEVRQRRFRRWLDDNLQALPGGSAEYQGVKLSRETEVVVFHLAISVIVASFKIPSQILIVGHDRIWFWRALYSVFSLVFGWWGIPWGPVYTVQALHSNLRTLERSRLLDTIAAEGWTAGSGSRPASVARS